ncbi:dipeptide ABC transporter permease DppC [Labrys miyagiensis]|uniref:Dipeptide ABC transporter permease DppC n=1 Tax=Labrys miyagiensis TaxID=346912 RepID=A0ABQ6CSE9_9HYPH|nr:ABC transporter permease subunit [Labrys miyagiensis]GLS23296.1 dipeptide ABC transporter permease DppC [Labrys miyagiensis]
MAADTQVTAVVVTGQPLSGPGEIWHALKQNKGAVAGLVVLVLIVLVAIFADVLAPYAPYNAAGWPDAGHPGHIGQPPAWVEGGSWDFILGTDKTGGRDVLSRLIYGARYSLGIGLTVMMVSMVIGSVLGLLAAYLGGWFDFALMRLMDMIMSIPDLVLSMVVVAILEPGLGPTVAAITIVFLPRYVRIVRAAALAELSKDYVMAAKVVGVRPLRLLFRTVLPNCMAPLIVQATLGVSDAILQAAALGFLGMGAQPPTPEWGAMLSDVRQEIQSAPWLAISPGVCILVTVVAINLFGDGLRDALDPKLKRS